MKIKVVIFGEADCGKSTLVRHFIPNATSVEASAADGRDITVALDFGKINISGYLLHFFGTPGQHRFNFARKIVARGAHIGILLVDSEMASEIGVTNREKVMEEELIALKIPYIICANKRDLLNVLPIKEIQSQFTETVIPVSAKTGEGIGLLMENMFDLIDDHYTEEELVKA